MRDAGDPWISLLADAELPPADEALIPEVAKKNARLQSEMRFVFEPEFSLLRSMHDTIALGPLPLGFDDPQGDC